MTTLSVPKLDDEAGRLAALRRYEIIDTESEQEFEDIIGLVRSFFGLPIAAISLLDANRQWFKASVGLVETETPRSVAFCHYTAESARTMAVEDATRDPRFAANPLVTAQPGIRCYLGVPLTTPDGYNIGTLCVLGTEPRSFTPTDEEVLKNFGRLVISQMELRLLAQRDALTDTLSRAAFEQVLRAAFRQSKSDGTAMSLLMMDIDRFKSINDEFGHPVGDLVIKAVAQAAIGGLRRTDHIGRLGGEEFGALLKGASLVATAEIAERMRRAVSQLQIPELRGARLTVSVGAAGCHESIRDVKDWIATADAALYEAKRTGRNRVVEAPGAATIQSRCA